MFDREDKMLVRVLITVLLIGIASIFTSLIIIAFHVANHF